MSQSNEEPEMEIAFSNLRGIVHGIRVGYERALEAAANKATDNKYMTRLINAEAEREEFRNLLDQKTMLLINAHNDIKKLKKDNEELMRRITLSERFNHEYFDSKKRGFFFGFRFR